MNADQITDQRQTNRLIHESSPYLRQHARNPVQWYPWGSEALDKARQEDKLIFLSIGYSTCHWCHVMERESFENAFIAALLNRNFVPIKVDREERPDIDAIYMDAVQRMTGAGGWPLSVFLSPDQVPLFGGTYFPPEDRWGQPGFKYLLQAVAEAWSHKREGLLDFGQSLTEAMRQDVKTKSTALETQALKRVADQFRGVFDEKHGGFGQAPKFPQPGILALQLRHWQRHGDEESLHCVVKTLEAMAAGGIHDQLGGGFHRYSVDAHWLVPHFEKMLYDQAQLGLIYSQVATVAGRQDLAEVARGIYDFVLREMLAPEGGFYAAWDADSEGQEGTYYVWTLSQLRHHLTVEQTDWAASYWGVTEQGNFEAGTNVLHVDNAQMDTSPLAEIKATLLKARQQRVPPHRDEKIISAWNGMMIQSLAYAGRVLREPRYIQAALRAGDFVVEVLKKEDRLRRSYTDGQLGGDGYLDDYAWMVTALVELYQATLEIRWLEQAVALAQTTVSLFADSEGGAYFSTGLDSETLLMRRKDLLDGALPSANAVLAAALIRLSRLTRQSHWRQQAEAILQGLSVGLLSDWGGRFSAACAIDDLLEPGWEAVIAGPWSDAAVQEMLATLQTWGTPGLICHCVNTEENDHNADRYLEGDYTDSSVGQDQGSPRVYLCREGACQNPIYDIEQLHEVW